MEFLTPQGVEGNVSYIACIPRELLVESLFQQLPREDNLHFSVYRLLLRFGAVGYRKTLNPKPHKVGNRIKDK